MFKHHFDMSFDDLELISDDELQILKDEMEEFSNLIPFHVKCVECVNDLVGQKD